MFYIYNIRAQKINSAVRKQKVLTDRWVLMKPVLTQLRNPRTQPKWFLGFFLAVKTYICWVDILLHKTSHCLRIQREISRYAQLPKESRAPRTNICRKESVLRSNCRSAQITLMPMEMRLLYCESTEMSFDRGKCFQLRTEITNARFGAV